MAAHSEVATLVRTARKARGMSREALAAAVGRSRTTVRRLEAASPDAVVPLDLPLAKALIEALGHPPQSARLLEIGTARGTSVRGRWSPPLPGKVSPVTPTTEVPKSSPPGAIRTLLAERFGTAATAPPPQRTLQASTGDSGAVRRAMQQIARAAHAPFREGLSPIEWAVGVSYAVATLATSGVGLTREGRITGLVGELATLAGPSGHELVTLEPAARDQLEAWMQASGEADAIRCASVVLAACWGEPDIRPIGDALLRGMSAAAHTPRRGNV